MTRLCLDTSAYSNPVTVEWGTQPDDGADSCSVEHLLPDGSSHPDGRNWGLGVSGSRIATLAAAGTHTFVLRCQGPGGTCSSSAKHLVKTRATKTPLY